MMRTAVATTTKALTIGALVSPLLPICAGAQAPQADAPAPNPGVERRVTDTRPSPRRYKVEALRFRAIDESGYDFLGSDEIIAIVRVPAHNVLTASKIFGDVDGGETRSFARNQSCILPIAGLNANFNVVRADHGDTWTCSANGAPGPFAFTVEMYEKDDGFFHDCIRLELGCEFSTGPSSGNDDLVGRRTLVFPESELAAVMPNVNDTFEESIKLGPCHDENVVCGSGWLGWSGPEYKFTWRLTRLPDGPVLDPSPGLSPQASAR
jgi:hypothetical protein